jgi:hypothetical protein
MIVLEPTVNQGSVAGLLIDAPNVTVKGLVISNFASPGLTDWTGLVLAGGNAVVQDCFIGTDPTGMRPAQTTSTAQGTSTGIWVTSSNNIIGSGNDTIPIGGEQSTRNIISGNTSYGIIIDGFDIPDTSSNRVQGNFIGLAADGQTVLGNGRGILVYNSNSNTVARDVVSGNDLQNVLLQGTSASNVVQGNEIGTDVGGLNPAVPVPPTGGVVGVDVLGASNNTIGGTTAGARNVISSNGIGVFLEQGAYSNTVEGNDIGTDQSGTEPLANRVGVDIRNSPNNLIGGPMPFSFGAPIVDGPANVIAGNQQTGVQIEGAQSTGNLLESNRIGTPLNGGRTAVSPGGDMGNGFSGVSILSCSGNTLGGDGSDQGNFIAGNQQNGIAITGADAKGNQILGNYIGTDPQLRMDVGNTLDGVLIEDAPQTIIKKNTIVGNLGEGIRINGATAIASDVEFNHIGLFAGADAQAFLLTNPKDGNGQDGVLIKGPATSDETQRTQISFNSISANGVSAQIVPESLDPVIRFSATGGYGIDIQNAAAVTVQGNRIGTDETGTLTDPDQVPRDGDELGNFASGITILNSSNILVGDPSAGVSNLISGNGASGFGDGVDILNSSLVTLQDNCIGTNLAGTAALPNRDAGVAIFGGSGNRIGTSGTRNLISGNRSWVIVIAGSSSGNHVAGNFVGTQAAGIGALKNGTGGIVISQATGNFIGSVISSGFDSNVISGNDGYGVAMLDGASGNQVEGNRIGLDSHGDRLANQVAGVLLSGASGNSIGVLVDPMVALSNIISGNGRDGIQITNGSTNNHVDGNFIGTGSDGSTPRPNGTAALGGSGIVIDNSPTNFIGQKVSRPYDNVISGNQDYGITIVNGATGNEVQSNIIGLDAAQTKKVPNGTAGIKISNAGANFIGLTDSTPNIISGNQFNGIEIDGFGTQPNITNANRVLFNKIGIASNGNPFGNGNDSRAISAGVRIIAANSTQLLGDQIQNSSRGVEIDGSALVTIERCVIKANETGITFDPSLFGEPPSHDNTVGPNNTVTGNNLGVYVPTDPTVQRTTVTASRIFDNQKDNLVAPFAHPPVILSGTFSGSVHVEGMLNGSPNTAYDVEFFASSGPGASGAGEAEDFLGSETYTTDAAGQLTFRADFDVPIPVGWFITATVTGPDGDTSGFTPPMVLTPPPPPDGCS